MVLAKGSAKREKQVCSVICRYGHSKRLSTQLEKWLSKILKLKL
jgi:hypothetical protein